MRLAWNAIVKNEAARLSRCLASIMPHVDGAVVVDTGSTDGTQDYIKQCFADANKPLEIHSAPFKNFSQARNEALSAARASKLAWDYLLLADADMELVVQQPNWINGADGLSYDMKQVAGGITYWNKRLLSRKAQGIYVGVTHEYLDVPTSGSIDRAYFIDHADGANRAGKFTRDIALLEEALKTETNAGLIGRYYFYLAQSYFDQGAWAKAADYYKKRVEHGGWDEEVWNAKLHYAHCLGNLGDHAGFVWELLDAYEMRPQRAETLYDLAKYFREREGANYRSLLFSEPGMRIERPDDKLFVADYVYHTGLKEEFAICGYYDPARRERAGATCNTLALDRTGTDLSREQARRNQYWYLKPLSAQVPSFQPVKINFTPPDGYAPMNPSVINHHGKPLVLIRTVNYAITPEGQYVARNGTPFVGHSVIVTRNFLARVLDHGEVEHQAEIQLPDLPEPKFELVRGFEDSRLFEWNGQLWTLSTVRELTHEGWCEQVLAPIEDRGDQVRYGAWKRISPPGDKRHEKNWMPWPRAGLSRELHFVYRLGTVLDVTGARIYSAEPHQTLDHISGGSQVIAVAPSLYLALVHEAGHIPGHATRYYQHRFVTFTGAGSVLDISAPFYFHDRQIEFAAGMARFGDRLLISYGVRDEEAWMAWMRLDEVLRFT